MHKHLLQAHKPSIFVANGENDECLEIGSNELDGEDGDKRGQAEVSTALSSRRHIIIRRFREI